MSKFIIVYVEQLADIAHLLRKKKPLNWQVIPQDKVVPKYAVIMELSDGKD